MRVILGAVAIVVGAVVCLAQGDDEAVPEAAEGPAVIAARILEPDGASEARVEREEELRRMNGHYVAVRKEVLECLRRPEVRKVERVEFGEPLHWALLTVRTWRITEAEGDILDKCHVVLDSSTVPLGRMMAISDYYPFAKALSALPLKSEVLVTRFSSGNYRVLTWVLATSRGRGEAKLLLQHYVEGGRYDTAALRESVELLETVPRVDELLPIPWESEGE